MKYEVTLAKAGNQVRFYASLIQVLDGGVLYAEDTYAQPGWFAPGTWTHVLPVEDDHGPKA